ncbi:MAG: type II toxin-antitoxin system RelB/DinJ family antitoxin [Rhodospirillaceae bacterium]|nr:type II toxin-antitoxin system RelB/DinJ family antitoxin [Rhodospirillaceae bacterium]
MTKTAMVRARMEPGLKKDAERVMKHIGISPTEAIRLFYRQVTVHRGLPFELRIPNAEMREAIADTRARKNLTTFKSIRALMRTADE